ncbi:hypothetical protein [Rhizobium miluonense]|uniref:Uncharacterized protein n=1 Tax=Rhizobium miluonense TaxID=411945 RepID=A0A1C3XA74_9HYPH|nr:hypothetical protein [Rhizobium miluonense]SCB49121.1 hypothetical protein GA0061102_107120 [Rhizobium miluonense]
MTDPLSKLPMFATDREIAIAIVGKERAAMFVKAVIPQFERKGFPKIDPLHDGRPVPLVRKFYDGYFGITAGFNVAVPDGEENLGAWKPKRESRNKRKPQLGLDGRSQKALLYMVAHPDARTHGAIPDAGMTTMNRLAEKGAVVAGKKDRDGDTEWKVTDIGVEEAKRIGFWHHGKSL